MYFLTSISNESYNIAMKIHVTVVNVQQLAYDECLLT